MCKMLTHRRTSASHGSSGKKFSLYTHLPVPRNLDIRGSLIPIICFLGSNKNMRALENLEFFKTVQNLTDFESNRLNEMS